MCNTMVLKDERYLFKYLTVLVPLLVNTCVVVIVIVAIATSS